MTALTVAPSTVIASHEVNTEQDQPRESTGNISNASLAELHRERMARYPTKQPVATNSTTNSTNGNASSEVHDPDEAFARRLQEEENNIGSASADQLLAQKLQSEELQAASRHDAHNELKPGSSHSAELLRNFTACALRVFKFSDRLLSFTQ